AQRRRKHSRGDESDERQGRSQPGRSGLVVQQVVRHRSGVVGDFSGGHHFVPVLAESLPVGRPQRRWHLQSGAQQCVFLVYSFCCFVVQRPEDPLVQQGGRVVERRRDPQLQLGVERVVPGTSHFRVRLGDQFG